MWEVGSQGYLTTAKSDYQSKLTITGIENYPWYKGQSHALDVLFASNVLPTSRVAI